MSNINVTDNITLTWNGTNFIDNNDNSYDIPLTVTNTNISPTQAVVITLVFENTISNTNVCININSGYLTFDAQGVSISVDASNYNGLFSADTIYRNVSVQNINMILGSGNLSNNAGWICKQNTVGVIAFNCSSTGNIIGGGGIFGSNCSNCTANNCHSVGNITNGTSGGGGGIFGSSCLRCSANNCFSSGTISNGSGGIFGAQCNIGSNSGLCSANGCYSIGTIGTGYNDYNNGGIFGSKCNFNGFGSHCNATNCFSIGSIYGDNGGNNGGIFGGNAIGLCSAFACYSIGNIGQGCGGIFCGGSSLFAINSYSIGSIGTLAGGIFGSPVTNCNASACYSIGNIGPSGGGIFAGGAPGSVTSCNAINCYTLGNISFSAGTIFGEEATDSTCMNCYVLTGNDAVNGFFGGIDNITNGNTIDTCFVDESWTDTNANSILATDDYVNAWLSTAPNTPFLLTIFTDCSGMVPPGFQYYYTIPSNSNTIASNETILYSLLNGFYSQMQDDSTNVSASIYGYNINNQTVTTNVNNVISYPLVLLINELNKNNPKLL